MAEIDTTAPRTVALADGAPLVLRPAVVADAPAVAALERALAAAGDGVVVTVDQVRDATAEAHRIDAMYRDWSAGAASMIAVAELAGAVVAHASLRQLAPARCRHVGVLAIGVAAAARRRGVAAALLGYLVDHAAACGLERLELTVRADNAPAHALYRRLGFVRESTRARFVRLDDGRYVDDLVMVRFLPAIG